MRGFSNLRGRYKFAYVHSFKNIPAYVLPTNVFNVANNDKIDLYFGTYIQEMGFNLFRYDSLEWHCFDFKELGLSRYGNEHSIFKSDNLSYLDCNRILKPPVSSFNDVFKYLDCFYLNICKSSKNPNAHIYKENQPNSSFYGGTVSINDKYIIHGSRGSYVLESYEFLVRKVCNV